MAPFIGSLTQTAVPIYVPFYALIVPHDRNGRTRSSVFSRIACPYIRSSVSRLVQQYDRMCGNTFFPAGKAHVLFCRRLDVDAVDWNVKRL